MRTRRGDGADVPMIGATAAADHGKTREQGPQRAILAAQFLRVADIQLGALVELGMAQFRGVGAQTANAFAPGAAIMQDMFKMRRMRAVEIASLKERYARGASLASACSVSLWVAEAGLLDGWEATIHWGWCEYDAGAVSRRDGA